MRLRTINTWLRYIGLVMTVKYQQLDNDDSGPWLVLRIERRNAWLRSFAS